MSHFEIIRYTSERATEWNMFVNKSCNGSFLFCREFMDYHAHRFTDFSLMFYEEKQLVALLPACIEDDVLTSHGGLTYGGLVVSPTTTTIQQLNCIHALIEYCKQGNITTVIIKPIPYIYTSQPSEAYMYSFFKMGFNMSECGLSVAVNTHEPVPMRTLRLRGCRRGQKIGLRIIEGNENMASYHALLSDVLRSRHNVKPVHSLEEMQLLSSRFPNNIRLFTVFHDDTLVAGIWMFYTNTVAHAQYIAASETGTKEGALDYLICHLIANTRQNFFDFGICTENGGQYLNEGLLFQKEGFGARPVVYTQWMYTIKKQ